MRYLIIIVVMFASSSTIAQSETDPPLPIDGLHWLHYEMIDRVYWYLDAMDLDSYRASRVFVNEVELVEVDDNDGDDQTIRYEGDGNTVIGLRDWQNSKIFITWNSYTQWEVPAGNFHLSSRWYDDDGDGTLNVNQFGNRWYDPYDDLSDLDGDTFLNYTDCDADGDTWHYLNDVNDYDDSIYGDPNAEPQPGDYFDGCDDKQGIMNDGWMLIIDTLDNIEDDVNVITAYFDYYVPDMMDDIVTIRQNVQSISTNATSIRSDTHQMQGYLGRINDGTYLHQSYVKWGIDYGDERDTWKMIREIANSVYNYSGGETKLTLFDLVSQMNYGWSNPETPTGIYQVVEVMQTDISEMVAAFAIPLEPPLDETPYALWLRMTEALEDSDTGNTVTDIYDLVAIMVTELQRIETNTEPIENIEWKVVNILSDTSSIRGNMSSVALSNQEISTNTARLESIEESNNLVGDFVQRFGLLDSGNPTAYELMRQIANALGGSNLEDYDGMQDMSGDMVAEEWLPSDYEEHVNFGTIAESIDEHHDIFEFRDYEALDEEMNTEFEWEMAIFPGGQIGDLDIIEYRVPISMDWLNHARDLIRPIFIYFSALAGLWGVWSETKKQ